MKKLTALVLCLLIALVFCSCDKKNTAGDTSFPDDIFVSDFSDDEIPSDVMPNFSSSDTVSEEMESGIPEDEKPPKDPTVTLDPSSDFKDFSNQDSLIPNENPDPVDITREDAYEMTDISYTDSFTGETLDFNASSFEIFTDKDIKDGVAVVRSAKEMKSAVKKHAAADEKHIESFTDEFFKENAIIMLSHKQKAVDEYTIYDLVIKENAACVIIECGTRSVNGADACYITYIEVNKKDLAKAKYLTVNMVE